jgi:hypothetical protein
MCSLHIITVSSNQTDSCYCKLLSLAIPGTVAPVQVVAGKTLDLVDLDFVGFDIPDLDLADLAVAGLELVDLELHVLELV